MLLYFIWGVICGRFIEPYTFLSVLLYEQALNYYPYIITVEVIGAFVEGINETQHF